MQNHPISQMRDYLPTEIAWEYDIEYCKYSRPSFPTAFASRADFDAKFAAAPIVHLTIEQIKTLGNSMAASGIGRGEAWVHQTFSHRRDSKRILRDLTSGKTAPPIVLRKNGRLHLMAGQTRIAAGLAIGRMIPVKVIDVH